ncbi:MAG: hypothetical protein Q9164_001429 [Protoblastenia rupestris]
MAATTTFLLSSSPSRSVIATTPPGTTNIPFSSSPSLPSPSQLYTLKPLHVPRESTDASIPTDVTPGFASSATLLQSERSMVARKCPPGAERLGLAEKYKSQSSVGKPAKPTKIKPVEAKDTAFKKPPKDPKTKTQKPPDTLVNVDLDELEVDAKPGEEIDTASKKPRKPPKTKTQRLPATVKEMPDVSKAGAGVQLECQPKKARNKKLKQEDASQTKIKEVKVTKPGVEKSARKGKKEEVFGKTRKARSSTLSTLLADHDPAPTRKEPLDLHLDGATKRRANWTPVKDTLQGFTILADTPANAIPHRSCKSNTSEDFVFGSFLGGFGFSRPNDSATIATETMRMSSGGATFKRRKIELVTGLVCPPPAEKPKKKPQTITEKATAPFVPLKVKAAPSLLEYFETHSSATGVNKNASSESRSISPTKKMLKPRNAALKSRKRVENPIVLLSPETAVKKVRDQELIFGTSSQLAREESPTFIKDLQKALKESESIENQSESQGKLSGPLRMPALLHRPSSSLILNRPRSLWSAAARDFDESLLEAEIVDLSRTPRASTVKPRFEATAAQSYRELNADAKMPIDGDLNPQSDAAPELAVELEGIDAVFEKALPISVAEAALKNRPKDKVLAKKGSLIDGTPDTMPNYKGFTDFQLSKEIASCGFKAIKKRAAMISLLEKCWQSRRDMALQELPVNINVVPSAAGPTPRKIAENCSPVKKQGRPSKAATAAAKSTKPTDITPKKSRGRPRKDSSPARSPSNRTAKAKTQTKSTNMDLGDEIYDSAPPTPSPPRRRTPTKPAKQLPLSPSQGAATPKNTPAHHFRLLNSVTKAVTTFPPTNDPKNLTWYEKILMYEPIVIEDLAMWLNREGLGRVGEDDEVGPALVKEWCEGHSICCLWKENLRGRPRGRW